MLIFGAGLLPPTAAQPSGCCERGRGDGRAGAANQPDVEDGEINERANEPEQQLAGRATPPSRRRGWAQWAPRARRAPWRRHDKRTAAARARPPATPVRSCVLPAAQLWLLVRQLRAAKAPARLARPPACPPTCLSALLPAGDGGLCCARHRLAAGRPLRGRAARRPRSGRRRREPEPEPCFCFFLCVCACVRACVWVCLRVFACA